MNPRTHCPSNLHQTKEETNKRITFVFSLTRLSLFGLTFSPSLVRHHSKYPYKLSYVIQANRARNPKRLQIAETSPKSHHLKYRRSSSLMETPHRPRGEGDGGTPMTPTRDNSTLLREQEAERERLRMDNFNQALRINFLEERLLRMKQGTDFASEDLESELAQLRITLEERDHELRQRNFSMIRATEAIDMLNAQLHEAQAAAARAREEAQREAEDQLQHHLEERGGVDAETAEKWREELDSALHSEQQSQLKAQQLEQDLQRQKEAVDALTTQLQELQDARTRDQREMELRSQREQQTMQQVEMNNVKMSAEADHWKAASKQREEQITALQMQLEATGQEKQAQDVRYQAKLKRMEEQVQHQMEQLQRESENYRTEHTRLLTDREKTHFEKERLSMENESIKQERARLQAEIERMTKERQQLAGESERLRLQNVTLTAANEEMTKSLDSFKAEREVSLGTIHQLESELHQRRKMENEHELTIRTLESRLEHAEAEARRMKDQCDLAESRCQQTSNERLLALEKDRQAMEEDNRRLRTELAGFQVDLEAMERKFQDSEARFSDEAANTQEQRQHLLSYEQEVERLSAQLREYQNQLAGCEDELTRRANRVQELERQLTEAVAASSSSSSVARELQTEWQNQFTAARNSLERQLDEERRRANEAERTASALKTDSLSAQRDLEAVEMELRSLLSGHSLALSDQPALSLMREVISALKDEFQTETTAMQTRWKQQTSLLNSKLERLSTQLRSSQGKLDVLQRSAVHSKDAKQSLEKNWSLRYEELRLEKEEERQSLEEEIFYFQSKAEEAEEAFSKAASDLETLKRSQKDSHEDELDDLQRSPVHSKDVMQSLEKDWSLRYEKLRLEKEEERRSLEEEISYFQSKAAEAEEALSKTVSDLETMKRSQNDSHEDDYHGLKESNRLLFEEVQERRRSADHARKQYMQAVRENKELLKAIEMYKDAIAGRDKDIEKYKSAVMKYAQQLKRRVEFGEVKHTLLEQLEQTQYMISETYKRWEDSPIVRGPIVNSSGRVESYEAAILQLDEYIGRMQLVSERWSEFMTQSQELQQRYGDAWKSAARGFDRTKDQPRWVDDVERKCSRLLSEAVRVSETMRDVVNNIAGVLQKERGEKKRIEKERAIAVDNNASVKRRENPSSKWSPLDADFFEHQNTPRSQSASQPQLESPVKQNGLNTQRRNSKTSTSTHRSVNALYRSSLSSLGRVGLKVQDLEKEIRKGGDDGMPYRALRDQEAEYSRLQQENFNHKMRIDFLEEQLIRLNNGEKVFGSADLQTEVIQLRLKLEERLVQVLVQRREHQAQELQLALGLEKEKVEKLSKQIEYGQENYMREMNIAEITKQRYQEICEYQKKENNKFREELVHVRRMMKSKEELVETLRVKVASIRHSKEEQAKKHSATLSRLCDECSRVRVKEEQARAIWHATYTKLERNWITRNKELMEEIRNLKRYSDQ
ncbi:hypothetical protein P3T76_002054 [Phytophthora citrophthora]|uniref:Centrosomin N-terminal motif 1 domain-containing protein n=1 Tax=Phytophthora citrophthora TaxID=4793 RepID=A0AAD9GYR4_9STRA|nr:hypothetical protein P3T76_002054 [Phytophthora citrophthora]